MCTKPYHVNYIGVDLELFNKSSHGTEVTLSSNIVQNRLSFLKRRRYSVRMLLKQANMYISLSLYMYLISQVCFTTTLCDENSHDIHVILQSSKVEGL